MSNLLFFIIFILSCYLVTCLAIAPFKGNALFTLAIGCVIGANIYNIGSYPIQIGSLTFGMDGVIYTIFLFCLITTYIDSGKKSMNLVLYTALFSIFFTALLAFFGNWLQMGSVEKSQIWSTLSYVFSIIGSYIAVVVMFKIFEIFKSKNMNIYLNFALCMLIGNLINSIIYFGLTFLMMGAISENFIYSLLGSIITKTISTGLCVLVYYIYEKFWNKNLEKTE